MLFKVVGGRASEQTAVLKASTMWGDWTFAESQIRYAIQSKQLQLLGSC